MVCRIIGKVGQAREISAATCSPFRPGIAKSSTIMSGLSSMALANACWPSLASPQTCHPACDSISRRSSCRITWLSSANRICANHHLQVEFRFTCLREARNLAAPTRKPSVVHATERGISWEIPLILYLWQTMQSHRAIKTHAKSQRNCRREFAGKRDPQRATWISTRYA